MIHIAGLARPRLGAGRPRALVLAWLAIALAAVFVVSPSTRGPLPVAAPAIVAPPAAPAAKVGTPPAAAPAAAAKVGTPPAAAPAAAAPAAAAVGLAAAAAALAQAQRTGQAVPVSFRLSEQELTAAAARSFPQSIAGMTLSDPVIHLVPGASGSAQLVATAKFLFVTTQLVVSATPSVAGGRVVARLDAATLGGAGLPDAARGSIVAAFESAIAQVLPAKLQVATLTVDQGTIAFQGSALP